MELDIFKYSSVGGRANNEDYCDYFRDGDSSVLALADGLGGHECGEVASELAVKAILSSLQIDPELNLYEAISVAAQMIKQRQQQHPSLDAMRTTLVCARIHNGTLSFANIGDSRFYFFKNRQMLLRTKDHSVPQLSVDMGTMNEDDIRFSADRNKLLKVLGENTELVIPGDYPSLTVSPGDAFILCSDGFWENVFDLEMEADLSKASNAKDWARYMIKRLLLRVSGSHDNFSLICGRIV